MYLYETVCLVNGKKYVGSKKSAVEDSVDYLGSGRALKDAVAKFGKENFVKKILMVCDNYEYLKEMEIKYLTALDAANRSDYYNLHNNFSGGFNPAAYRKDSTAKIGLANSKRVLSEYQRKCSWMNTPEVNAKKHPRAVCVHCGVESNKGNIFRWHNEHCKSR
jgi:hypothetical protein